MIATKQRQTHDLEGIQVRSHYIEGRYHIYLAGERIAISADSLEDALFDAKGELEDAWTRYHNTQFGEIVTCFVEEDLFYAGTNDRRLTCDGRHLAEGPTRAKALDAAIKVLKLEVTNKILQSFAPDTRIEWRTGRGGQSGWYVCWKGYRGKENSKRFSLQSNGMYPTFKWPNGGTCLLALTQLVRWLKGMPVHGIGQWRYWAKYGLKADLDLLLSAGYPEQSRCVLCDQVIDTGYTWWSLNGVSGPCHFKDCRSEKLAACNEVLKLFAPESQIEQCGSVFRICWTRHDGMKFIEEWPNSSWPHGGRASDALGELLKWLQGQQVVGLDLSWERWVGHPCYLLHDSALEILKKAGYPQEVAA